ncbi:Two-component transcriptional response regulator, LuxR family [hydrothermal vent metagenome]|uniref:Two-component transcriptional response regulator, LuxR family n=1 Tax=hydrothermal vent metagenome TaxID=652676 RepID=A0A3B0S1S9_9ZZZZ
MTPPLRVLIADDQTLIRAGLKMIIDVEPHIEVVGEAENGEQAVALAHELTPDVVLMDIRMPVMDGITATGRIQEEIPSVKVLILTTFQLDEYVFAAIRAGASGFLLKDTPPAELVSAISIVAEGEALLAPSVTRQLVEHFRSGPAPTDPENNVRLALLTDRERDVLVELAQGSSNAEIADALFVSETTVKTHVSHLLTKLELRDRVQAVVFAYETELVRPGR